MTVKNYGHGRMDPKKIPYWGIYETRECRICGRVFAYKTKPGGRGYVTCHPDCAKKNETPAKRTPSAESVALVLDTMRQKHRPMTIRDITKVTNKAPSTVGYAIRALAKKGAIRQVRPRAGQRAATWEVVG